MPNLPTPITCDDILKNKILTGDMTNLPDIITRQQMYLKSMLLGNNDIQEPVTRIDYYMKAAITNDISDLPTPITRSDMYWYAIASRNSSNLPEPITRSEIFDYNLALFLGKSIYKVEEEDSRLIKTGTWAYESSPNYYDNGKGCYSNTSGSKISLTFTGVGVKYRSVKNKNLGIVKVILDGVYQEIDLYNPMLLKSSNVFSSGVLETKEHTISIEVTQNKNVNATDWFVILDNFEITT